MIATAGWHLGAVRHMEAAAAGYDQATEDELLERIDWRADGYRLFEVSTLAGSSGRGWFGPLSESSARCSCPQTSGPIWAGSTSASPCRAVAW